jgi:CBS domain-containing protein
VRPYEALAKVARLLGVRGYSHAMVVDDYDVLLGVVSVKDVARRILSAFESAGALEGLNVEAILREQVHTVMSRPPIVLRVDDYEPCAAAEVMAERSIGVIPLVDDSGRLVGAVSELDFAFELLKEDEKAANFATANPVFGDGNETVLEALGEMLERGFRRLPIRSGNGVYMATMHGILLAIARQPRVDTMLQKVGSIAQPAIVLQDTASISEASEAILASTERAVLILDGGSGGYSILTERDLVRAYHSLRCS